METTQVNTHITYKNPDGDWIHFTRIDTGETSKFNMPQMLLDKSHIPLLKFLLRELEDELSNPVKSV
jgi:hypothetical protein